MYKHSKVYHLNAVLWRSHGALLGLTHIAWSGHIQICRWVNLRLSVSSIRSLHVTKKVSYLFNTVVSWQTTNSSRWQTRNTLAYRAFNIMAEKPPASFKALGAECVKTSQSAWLVEFIEAHGAFQQFIQFTSGPKGIRHWCCHLLTVNMNTNQLPVTQQKYKE